MPAPTLIAGPYRAPALRRGDRVTCLYRDSPVVVTAWTSAPIPWPRCRAVDSRGGSGLLVEDELRRAILTESAEALKHWFGVSTKAVWNWRRAFGVTQFGTEGSKRLQRAASERGADILRGKPAPPRRPALRDDLRDLLALAHAKRWEGRGWRPEDVALLGTMPDADLAKRLGRTTLAVGLKRRRAGIRAYRSGGPS